MGEVIVIFDGCIEEIGFDFFEKLLRLKFERIQLFRIFDDKMYELIYELVISKKQYLCIGLKYLFVVEDIFDFWLKFLILGRLKNCIKISGLCFK